MNERILELAKNDLIRDEYTEFGWQECHYYRFDPDELQKFAESIVKECAEIAVFKDSGTIATADVAGHMAAGRSIAARLIKEHFGVEE